MNRFFRLLLILTASFTVTGVASAATYYVAANGSDSNNGTSKNTPWLHAPGMATCSQVCASTNPQPGDQFIFRGGDTWHFGNGSASPYAGSAGWTWKWNGSSSSTIYIGVDQTWYSGGAWVRPVMNGDNPLSDSFVKSCAYDDSTSTELTLSQVSYVTVDNFEWPGRCWSSPSSNSAAIYSYQTCHIILSNHYFHGWTVVSGAEDNQMIDGDATGSCGYTTYNQISGNVFDGSDSSAGAANSAGCASGFEPGMPCQSGVGIYGEGYDIHDNVFRYMSNMAVTVNTTTYHDNLAEYLYTSFAPANIAPHSNVLNVVTNASGASIHFYNNMIRHTYVTETIYLAIGSGGSAYIFNNVFFDNLRYDTNGDTAPRNCIQMEAQASSGTQTLYFYNNTMDDDTDDPTGGGCEIQFQQAGAPTYAWNGTAYFENNHLIGYANLAGLYYCNPGATCAIVDNGHEVIQATSVARAQGYTQSNNDAPTLVTNATVGAGASLTNLCATFSSDSELCGGTSDGSKEQGSGSEMIAIFPAIAMVPRLTAWDGGAYQFGGSAPNPPTGLAAVVQ